MRTLILEKNDGSVVINGNPKSIDSEQVFDMLEELHSINYFNHIGIVDDDGELEVFQKSLSIINGQQWWDIINMYKNLENKNKVSQIMKIYFADVDTDFVKWVVNYLREYYKESIKRPLNNENIKDDEDVDYTLLLDEDVDYTLLLDNELERIYTDYDGTSFSLDEEQYEQLLGYVFSSKPTSEENLHELVEEYLNKNDIDYTPDSSLDDLVTIVVEEFENYSPHYY